jgi:hypothetical protein
MWASSGLLNVATVIMDGIKSVSSGTISAAPVGFPSMKYSPEDGAEEIHGFPKGDNAHRVIPVEFWMA